MKYMLIIMTISLNIYSAEIEILNDNFIKIYYNSRNAITEEIFNKNKIISFGHKKYKKNFKKFWYSEAYNSEKYKDLKNEYFIKVENSIFEKFEISKEDYLKILNLLIKKEEVPISENP